MVISVIGGSGFVGTRFCSRLLKSKTKFEILDLKDSETFSKYRKYCDVRKPETLSSSIKGNTIVLLAAVHRDDASAKDYLETNVKGAENVCAIATMQGIDTIIFTSTVAVYGFATPNADENTPANPFNAYGRTKWEAEGILKAWQKEKPKKRRLVIIRPTVIFGEGNRGNVFNLFNQIYKKRFLMIGSGENFKSMAYIENITAFLEHNLKAKPGINIFNYVDKPDQSMNELVSLVRGKLFNKNNVGLRLPAWLGMTLGYIADLASLIIRKNFPISSIRVKKFIATTSFSAKVAHSQKGFTAPVKLEDGIKATLDSEFINPDPNAIKFYTE